MILVSKEIFVIFEYNIYSKRYMEDTYRDPKMCSGFNMFKITKVTKLKDS